MKAREDIPDRGILVAHRQLDDRITSLVPANLVCKIGTMKEKRRPSLCPDLPVGRCRFSRTLAQDDAMKKEESRQGIDIQHPRIRKKFMQVPANVFNIRRVRGPQVQQDQGSVLGAASLSTYKNEARF